MRYDSVFNNALDDLYRPAAFVSAVILFVLFLASPAQANYIYDNATGSWKPTSRTVLAPPGAGSPFSYVPRDSPPTVSSTGAFQNKTGGTFGSPPINGTSRNVPVTITGTVPKSSVNKALLSRLGKGGLAGIALGAGIDALLDGIGSLIDEAGNVVIPPTDPSYTDPTSGHYRASSAAPGYPSSPYPSAKAACAVNTGCIDYNACTPRQVSAVQFFCEEPNGNARGSATKVGSLVCPSGSIETPAGCVPTNQYVPVPPDALEDAIDSSYQPHPSDYPFLSSDPNMSPQTTEVDPIPRLTLPPTTTTTIDLDTGKTTVVETNIWHDFNIKDNASEQPKIEAETTTKSDTFVDGDQTSSTTITNNTGFANPEGAYDSDGNRLDIPPPTDCDLFPTACAWMEWTQEEPEEPDDDLSELLQEVPIVNETFTITGGSAACPAPLVLNLSQFGSREVSYQPLCDLASTMKFLYLALMSFAAAVLLHRSISRV